MPRRKNTKHSPATRAKIAKATAASSKAVWAALSPEERASRIAKMTAGRKYDRIGKAVSATLMSRWQLRGDAARKAVGQRLARGRARWKEENPEEWAAMEARRRQAIRQYHANVAPEKKRERIEKSARGKLLKAQARAEACPTVSWKPDGDRLNSFLRGISDGLE